VISITSYYNEFKSLRKYTGQMDLIAGAIDTYFQDNGLPDKKEFRFLDIGANDGKLTEKVEDIIFKKGKNVITTAIEPDKVPFSHLPKTQSRRNLNMDLESFLDVNNCSYDVILASHMLYHISQDDWVPLTDKLVDILNPKGKLFVTLDSSDSDIYRFIEQSGLAKSKRDFGELVFSQDYERVLQQQRIYYEKRIISSTIKVPHKNMIDDVLRFNLGFLSRSDQKEIVKRQHEIDQWMKEHTSKPGISTFSWQQAMFILGSKSTN